MKYSKIAIAVLAIVGSVISMTGIGQTADYPEKPIRMIIPYEPGGGSDAIVLAFIDKLAEVLGQPVVREYRGGGSSTIGTTLLGQSPADGYTIGFLPTAFVANPYLYANIPYDWRTDFVPVTQLVDLPYILAARHDFPANTISELVAYAKANPNKVTVASTGRGAGVDMAAGLLTQEAGIELRRVTFKGSGPALIQVAGGFVDMVFGNISAIRPFVDSGKMKIMGATGSQPLPNSDIVPIADQGVEGYEFTNWYFIAAPAQTPPDIVKKLEEAFGQALNDTAVKERLQGMYANVVASTSEDTKAFLEAESEKARLILGHLGEKPE